MPLWSDAIWDPFSAEVHDSHTGIKPEHRCQPRLWSRVLSTKLRRRPRILCSAADDLFDKNVPEQIRTRLWNLIDETPELDWLLLTKQIAGVDAMLPPGWDVGFENVMLGVSITNQAEANRDIPQLLSIPAWRRFVSVEPLLTRVELKSTWTSKRPGFDRLFRGLDWLIAGGESGPAARPVNPQWVRALRDQCANAGVPFHFEQWGEWGPFPIDMPKAQLRAQRLPLDEIRGMWKCGEKAAGRALDGVVHSVPSLHDESPGIVG